MSLFSLTLHEASEKLRKREFSSQELTGALFQRIVNVEESVRAYITLCRDLAMVQAKQADKLLADSQPGSPLLGTVSPLRS